MKIGLMYAMPGEIESLLAQEGTHLLQTVAGVSFYHIREDVIACCGGVGKVNAAMATQLLITLYRPDVILNAGVAGCFEEVPIGTLVLAEGFVQHDVDTTGVGDPVGLVSTVKQITFPTSDFAAAKAAMDKVGLPYRTGLVATGDWFAVPCQRTQWIADTFHPLLCEMEGCAVAQVCMRNGVKCMAIKSVSDCLVVKHDYYFNFPTAMKDLNRVVMSFIDHLEV
ncbi:MAG: 5'-methylthioadenosine/S-adenosylhomocysteine nucleosidase [Clostridiales bacterium]|nr:5'-methylthioadenosine/S-adenosylhomocysteine nucleosidase [Oscillospiraceae bacterium]MDD5906306.1 5'-methylthioadenosine/S-adenosylhomocysteine nucleosidase [Clostridiales bacterium]